MDKDKNIPIRTPLKEIKEKFIVTTFLFLKMGLSGWGEGSVLKYVNCKNLLGGTLF